MKPISDDKVIERFEGIFSNRDEKLKSSILLEPNMRRFYAVFQERGRKSIKLASFLYNFSLLEGFDADFAEQIRKVKMRYFISPETSFFDWVIEIAYYGMYDLATSAIAKEGFKCTTHYTTRLALEYLYCTKGTNIKKIFQIYDRVLLKRKLVQDLKEAQGKRETARYRAPDCISRKDAEEVLEDAKGFEKEMLLLLLEKRFSQ